MDVKIPILQVVGYQNSGKTTVMANLIEEGSRHRWRIASLKHHGHGGVPYIQESNKDSSRHRRAGAMVSGIEGGGMLQITGDKLQWSLEEILSVYQLFSIDIILIEGYKQANYPKILTVKGEEELKLIEQVQDVVAVISQQPLKTGVPSLPFFLLKEEDKYKEWFIQFMGRKMDGASI